MTLTLCIIGAFIVGVVVSAMFYEKALAEAKKDLAVVEAEAAAVKQHAHAVLDSFVNNIVKEFHAAKQAASEVKDAAKKVV